jgi:hypothetical protein
MVTMVVGSRSDVDDVVKTAPWGTEQYVAVRRCRLDGELGWSLFIRADINAGDNVEGLVYAVAPDRKRAAVIGLAARGRIYEIDKRLRNTTTGGLDFREVARLLQRPYQGGGMLWGKPRVEGQIE